MYICDSKKQDELCNIYIYKLIYLPASVFCSFPFPNFVFLFSNPIKRLPLLGGKELDLYHLFTKVLSLGGSEKVTPTHLLCQCSPRSRVLYDHVLLAIKALYLL